MKYGKWALLAVALYVGISCVSFRLRNPELTEPQALMRIGDALIWRDAPQTYQQEK